LSHHRIHCPCYLTARHIRRASFSGGSVLVPHWKLFYQWDHGGRARWAVNKPDSKLPNSADTGHRVGKIVVYLSSNPAILHTHTLTCQLEQAQDFYSQICISDTDRHERGGCPTIEGCTADLEGVPSSLDMCMFLTLEWDVNVPGLRSNNG
jgi:hypothetical protein